MSAGVAVRQARRTDIPLLLALIVELADYERARERVTGSEQLLEAALFGDDAVAEAVIAEHDDSVAGFALFFRTFSTWLCLPGMWLEDLYVSPAHRRAGVGRALLSHLARIAVDRGYGRIEWSALHWNTPALDFYEALGAVRLEEWKGFRLEGSSLARAADGPIPRLSQ